VGRPASVTYQAAANSGQHAHGDSHRSAQARDQYFVRRDRQQRRAEGILEDRAIGIPEQRSNPECGKRAGGGHPDVVDNRRSRMAAGRCLSRAAQRGDDAEHQSAKKHRAPGA
jgi:hypothetical protein